MLSLQTTFAVIVGNEEYTFPFNDSHRRWGNHKQRSKYINHNSNRRRRKKEERKEEEEDDEVRGEEKGT